MPFYRGGTIRMNESEIDGHIPDATTWTQDECAQWIVDLGFPQYKECFVDNLISGKKLIMLNNNSLTKMGITDFEHLKIISSGLRELVHQPPDDYRRTIALPHRDPMGIFLEKKVATGANIDSATYYRWLKQNQRLLTACYAKNPFDDYRKKL